MQRVMGILLVLGLAVSWATMAAAAEEGKIRTLVITGDDAAPAHNWKEIATATRQVLEADGRFDVRVSEDPLILESKTALSQYDVIVFLMYNKVLPTITPAAQQNLLEFARTKGFYVQHLASASFPEWSDFGKLCGRYWLMKTSGHGPRSVFTANVVDRQHPITKGLEDFQIDDELYAKLQGDAPIQVLVSAHSDWSGKTEPLVFTQPYGQGRVVYNAFGHDAKALATPAVQRLIVRGVEFAAKGSVSEAK